MTEQIVKLKQRLFVGRKRDGRNCYDPQAKRELIEACLRPEVSVAKLALTHGVNANLLRTCVTKDQRQSSACGYLQASAAATLAPFIPVVAVTAQRYVFSNRWRDHQRYPPVFPTKGTIYAYAREPNAHRLTSVDFLASSACSKSSAMSEFSCRLTGQSWPCMHETYTAKTR